MIRMPFSFCSMEAIPVTHDETCETCKSRIVGVRNHRRGTFVDLCLVHFEMLAEQERAAYDAIESMPFISHSRVPHMCEWFPLADVVTKHDIVGALERGTWAELPVRDWDLRSASSLTAPLCTFLLSRRTRLARRHCN
jgi:hypothetical protein